MAEVEREIGRKAKPFMLTIDLFFATADARRAFMASGVLSPEAIGQLYSVDAAQVVAYELADINALKISFPRPVPSGVFGDIDAVDRFEHAPTQPRVDVLIVRKIACDDGRCVVYASRPFGCRTFFCDRAEGPAGERAAPRAEIGRIARDIAALSARFAPADPGPRPRG